MRMALLGSRTRRVAAALPLVAGLTLSMGCDLAVSGFREEEQDTWTRSYTLAEGGSVEIDNTNGFIDVSVGSGDRVEISVQRIARAASDDAAKSLLAGITMKETVTPERVHIAHERPRQGLSMGGGVELRYTVKVPASAKVDLQNTNGRVSVVDVRGDAALQTTNGEISARNLGGRVRASTTNGGVEIDLTSLASDVRVETTNGGVTVKLPAEAKASLSARCVNGGIDVEGLTVEEVEKSRRRLEARLNGGGARVEVETTNGGITFARR